MKTGHSRTKSLSELVDLFPTLVDLCQLPHPTGLEGKSLVPVLEKPELALKPAAFTQHPRPAYFDREPGKVPKAMGVSVRTASVRYTEWRDWISGDVVASELYSLSEDPRETVNKVNAPEVATRQREAAALLRKQFPPQAHR
jgi:iduronate 2-sulfatase